MKFSSMHVRDLGMNFSLFPLHSNVEAVLITVGGGGDEEEGQQEPLQKAKGMSRADALPGAAEAGPPCPHLQPDPQTGLQWQEGSMKRELARATWMEGGGGLPPCSKMQEHRIPLPATELGGTALVTTKTVKEGD